MKRLPRASGRPLASPRSRNPEHTKLGAVGARHLGGDEALLLEEVQVASRELGKGMRLAEFTAHRANDSGYLLGDDLKRSQAAAYENSRIGIRQSPECACGVAPPNTPCETDLRVCYSRGIFINRTEAASRRRTCWPTCGRPRSSASRQGARTDNERRRLSLSADCASFAQTLNGDQS